MDLDGANVLVTGGSRGIGEALAREFSSAGSKVAVAARSETDLKRVADGIGGHAFVVDLADDRQVDGLIGRVEAEIGPIDVLVNNAGLETHDQFATVDAAHIRDVSRVNFEAPLVLTRNVIRGMAARDRGHLVFTSSLAGSAGFPGLAVYSGTKAGLNNFVAAIRLELNDTNIGTTIIAPGPVDTQMWDQLEDSGYTDKMLKRLRMMQLIPKIAPEKLAERAVKAIAADRRHVRHPRRLSLNFMLPEVPNRLSEALLAGIKFEKPPSPDS